MYCMAVSFWRSALARGSAHPNDGRGGTISTLGRRTADRRRLSEQQLRQLVRRAQHRVVAGVELVVWCAELFGGAALMRLRRIHGLCAADHRRRPFLIP